MNEISVTTTSLTTLIAGQDDTTTLSTTVDQSTKIAPNEMFTFAPLSTNPTPTTSTTTPIPPTTISTTPTPSLTKETTASPSTGTTPPTTTNKSASAQPPTTAANASTSTIYPVNTVNGPNGTLLDVDQLIANFSGGHLGGIGGGAGPLGYSIVGALLLCAALTVAAMVLYRRRRHTTSLTEELQGIVSRARSHSLPVRYARFQDEHNMNGDNVSTISDTVTI